jgi:hypothetical protein
MKSPEEYSSSQATFYESREWSDFKELLELFREEAG